MNEDTPATTEDIPRKIERAIAGDNLGDVVEVLENVLVGHPMEPYASMGQLKNCLVLSAAKVAPMKVMGIVKGLSGPLDADIVGALLDAGLPDEANAVLAKSGPNFET